MEQSDVFGLQAFEDTNVCVSLTSIEDDMPLMYVNSAFERTTLYVREQVIGRNCRLLQGASTDANAVGVLAEAVRQRRQEGVCLLNYRANGEAFHNLVIVQPIQAAVGKTLLLGCQYDLSRAADASDLARHLEAVRGVVRQAKSSRVLESTFETSFVTADSISNRARRYLARQRQ